MHGSLTTPNNPTAADEVSHWTQVHTNAKKAGDKTLAERAKANLDAANARRAANKPTTTTDRRGLRKAAAV